MVKFACWKGCTKQWVISPATSSSTSANSTNVFSSGSLHRTESLCGGYLYQGMQSRSIDDEWRNRISRGRLCLSPVRPIYIRPLVRRTVLHCVIAVPLGARMEGSLLAPLNAYLHGLQGGELGRASRWITPPRARHIRQITCARTAVMRKPAASALFFIAWASLGAPRLGRGLMSRADCSPTFPGVCELPSTAF